MGLECEDVYPWVNSEVTTHRFAEFSLYFIYIKKEEEENKTPHIFTYSPLNSSFPSWVPKRTSYPVLQGHTGDLHDEKRRPGKCTEKGMLSRYTYFHANKYYG